MISSGRAITRLSGSARFRRITLPSSSLARPFPFKVEIAMNHCISSFQGVCRPVSQLIPAKPVPGRGSPGLYRSIIPAMIPATFSTISRLVVCRLPVSSSSSSSCASRSFKSDLMHPIVPITKIISSRMVATSLTCAGIPASLKAARILGRSRSPRTRSASSSVIFFSPPALAVLRLICPARCCCWRVPAAGCGHAPRSPPSPPHRRRR